MAYADKLWHEGLSRKSRTTNLTPSTYGNTTCYSLFLCEKSTTATHRVEWSWLSGLCALGLRVKAHPHKPLGHFSDLYWFYSCFDFISQVIIDRKLSIYVQNMTGINTKINSLNNALALSLFEIIAIQETCLTPAVLDSSIIGNTNYSLVRSDRCSFKSNKSRGGGVALLLSKKLPFSQFKIPIVTNLEYMAVIVTFHLEKIAIRHTQKTFQYHKWQRYWQNCLQWQTKS